MNEAREGAFQATEYNIRRKVQRKALLFRELEASLLFYQQKTPFNNNHMSISFSEDQGWAYMKNSTLISSLVRYSLRH